MYKRQASRRPPPPAADDSQRALEDMQLAAHLAGGDARLLSREVLVRALQQAQNVPVAQGSKCNRFKAQFGKDATSLRAAALACGFKETMVQQFVAMCDSLITMRATAAGGKRMNNSAELPPPWRDVEAHQYQRMTAADTAHRAAVRRLRASAETAEVYVSAANEATDARGAVLDR